MVFVFLSMRPFYLLLCFVLLFCRIGSAQSDFYRNYKGAKEKYQEGKYDDVLQISLKALEVAERTGVPTYLAYANTQVGNMYYLLGDRKNAIKWYMNAMAEIEKHDIDSMKSEIYHNTSVMYNEMKVMDSCLKYSNKAIGLLREKKKHLELSQALSALADIYIHQAPDFKKAEEVINEAEYYGRIANSENVQTFAIMKRTSLLAAQKKYREAIAVLNTTSSYYRKGSEIEGLMYYYDAQTKYRMMISDESAWKYNDSLAKLKDQVFKKETAQKIAQYETLYNTEKKERENKLLQQENLLQQARIVSRNRTIIGLAIGIILIGALVAWRLSVLNLRKKEKELELARSAQKEKERISRDLHDNVGGQLSYVLYSLEGLDDNDAGKRTELVTEINSSVRSVIGNLRETIWAINDESIPVSDLSDKLKVYVRQMFKHRNTKIVFSEKIEQNLQLNSLTGLNVYRICQEIVNNAFKHAAASELLVSIKASDRMEIEISDNGIGFDEEKLSDEGYGLANMKKRCEEAGVLMEVSSKPGKGTTYRLLV